MMLSLIYFFSFFLLASPLPYDISDLERLSLESRYEEFYAHMYDIRPAQRDGNWDKLVEKITENYIKTLKARTEISQSDLLQLVELSNVLILQKNEYFKHHTSEIIFSYFKKSFQDKNKLPQSLLDFKTFWNSPKPIGTGVQYYKLLKDIPSSPTRKEIQNLVLKEIINGSDAYQLADDEDFNKELFDQATEMFLSGQNFKFTLEKEYSSDIHEILIKIAKNHIKSNSPSPSLEISFEILTALKRIELEDEQLFYLLYLLDHPKPGKYFNLSWNFINDLKASPEKRQSLLSLVNKIFPLPGNILLVTDVQKKKVIVRQLTKNFPEYWENYLKTCFNYLQGRGTFPRGNPAINCRDLLLRHDDLGDLVKTEVWKNLVSNSKKIEPIK